MQASDGVIRRLDNLGELPLANRMKAHNQWNHSGRFVRMRFEASPAALDAVERTLRSDERVVRHLTTMGDLPGFASKATTAQPESLDVKDAEYFEHARRVFVAKLSKLDRFVATAMRTRLEKAGIDTSPPPKPVIDQSIARPALGGKAQPQQPSQRQQSVPSNKQGPK